MCVCDFLYFSDKGRRHGHQIHKGIMWYYIESCSLVSIFRMIPSTRLDGEARTRSPWRHTLVLGRVTFVRLLQKHNRIGFRCEPSLFTFWGNEWTIRETLSLKARARTLCNHGSVPKSHCQTHGSHATRATLLVVEKALYQLALLLCYAHSRVAVEGTLFKQRTNITMPRQGQKHGCESAVSRLESSRRISVWPVE